jgi:hypothetical protein
MLNLSKNILFYYKIKSKNLFRTAIISTNSSVNLPVLTQTNLSPFGFLIALLRLTKIIYQIDKSLSNSVKTKKKEFFLLQILFI